ncbi:HyaD/HybD family hydrogenase maturation endopeptidase [Thioalkalivibrio sp. XN8]|uniref:HyaD/HybD family hydrogenase maturation endopeptidase n=1 Tax=Thioalkalivibrio sp. XN8 TaxID=2712863 RepID=UPI0013ECA40C|nr:HyaD/HybD family hydrogenase maturation endopeptidase [Thioalkalivibrio sp. XN8]NGP54380.1 hydrogenase maturation protease [Thioalkalivibrio sp. XN8]
MSDQDHPKSGTLVLGVGNTILTDEGVGPWVVNGLYELNPEVPGITWMDGGTLSFSIAAFVEDAEQLIVVDATNLKAEPGTVQVFEDADMDRILGQHGRSVHEVGLMDLMNMARFADLMPRRRALVGIQPEIVDWGTAPSPRVALAMPEAARAVAALIKAWTGQHIRVS